MELTNNELTLLKELLNDAADWSGSPLWNQDDSKTKSDNAILGSLVKKGLVTTQEDEVTSMNMTRKGRFKSHKVQYVSFTETGLQYAATLGYTKEKLAIYE